MIDIVNKKAQPRLVLVSWKGCDSNWNTFWFQRCTLCSIHIELSSPVTEDEKTWVWENTVNTVKNKMQNESRKE